MKRALLLCLLPMLVGCASIGSVSTLRGYGHVRTYNAPYQTVWNAIPKAMESLHLATAIKDEKEGKILTDTPLTLFSYGEAIAVFVDKVDDSHTRVEVVSRKKMGTNIIAFSYQDRILNKLQEQLEKK